MPDLPTVIDARVRLPIDLRPPQAEAPLSMHRQRYDEVLDISEKLRAGTVSALLDGLREHGIGHAVVHAEHEGDGDAVVLSTATAQLVADHPTLFSGFGTITMPPRTGGAAGRDVQACADLGLIGVNIQPAFSGMDIHDRLLYSAYARAEELGLIVALHTGINYSRVYPMGHERPEYFDRIACDFPDLRLIACHGGWPWTTEYCAIARRHPTVYLELGGLAPQYVTRPGTGWDTLAGYLNNVLREQVLFATDWPTFSHERAIREWQSSGLRQDTLDYLLWQNARKLFGGPGLRRP